jgi:hypothetical protein
MGVYYLISAEDPEECDDNDIRYISELIRWTAYLQQRPSLRAEEGITTVHHPIKAESIIVSEEGNVAGLLDWDDVRVCPLWAVALPDMLLSEHNEEEVTVEECFKCPQEEVTPEHQVAFSTAIAKMSTSPMWENHQSDPDLPWQVESAVCTYWNRLNTYEKTQMRDVFLSTVSNLAPDWIDLSSRRRMDTTIATSVRRMVNGALLYFGQFERETLEPESARQPDDLSESSWPSDSHTVYEGSEVDE